MLVSSRTLLQGSPTTSGDVWRMNQQPQLPILCVVTESGRKMRFATVEVQRSVSPASLFMPIPRWRYCFTVVVCLTVGM